MSESAEGVTYVQPVSRTTYPVVRWMGEIDEPGITWLTEMYNLRAVYSTHKRTNGTERPMLKLHRGRSINSYTVFPGEYVLGLSTASGSCRVMSPKEYAEKYIEVES